MYRLDSALEDDSRSNKVTAHWKVLGFLSYHGLEWFNEPWPVLFESSGING